MSARSTKPVLTERQRVPPHLSSTERACTPSYPDRPLRKRSSAASTRLAEDSGYATANTTVMTAGTRRSGLSVSVGRDVGQEARKLSSGTTASTARGSLVANTTGRSRTSTTNSSITTVAATARPILKPRRVETQRLQTSISSRDGHLPPFTTTDAADIMKGRISDVTRRRMELRAVAATGCKLSSTPASHVHKSIPDVPSLNVRKSVRTRAREESREIVMESEREKERVERMQRLERLEKGKQRERELVEMQMQMEQQQIKRNAGGDVVNHETGRPAHAHKRVKSVHHYSKENRLPPAPAPASTRTHVSSIPPPSTIRASQRVKSKPKTTTYTSVSSTAPAQTRLPSAPIAHHVQHASTARPVDFKASVASYASTAGTTMRRVQKSSTSSSLSANMPSHASGHGSYSRILSETVAPSAAHTSTTSATVRSNSGGSSSAHAQQLLHQPNQKVQLHYTAPTQPTYLQTPQTQVQQDDFTFTTSYSTLFSRHIAKPTFPSSFHTASTTKTSRLRLFSNASSVNPFADRKMPGAPRCGKKDFRDLEKSGGTPVFVMKGVGRLMGREGEREVEVERMRLKEVFVPEYEEEILGVLRGREATIRINPHYALSPTQPTLTWSMRRVLINWLVQLHTHFNLLPETLFLTTHILDRFLSLRTVLTHNYHLVAVCALTLAAKFEQQYAPPLADLVKLAEEQYPLSLIITAERYILQKLEYDLSAFAGPVLWLRRLNGADGWDPRHRMLGKYLCELAMLEEGFVGVPASVVAAVAYAAAGWVLGTEWTETHTHLSTYTPSTLLPYVAPLLQCCFTHQDSAVGEKYAREEYFGIARTVPVYLAERGFGVAGEGEGVVGMDVDG